MPPREGRQGPPQAPAALLVRRYHELVLPPSGEQFELSAGASRAVVTEVGATLRLLELSGEAVILPFEVDALCRDGRGQLLAPWPNRLEDGRYEFMGAAGVAPLNEPERANAIHGLIRFWPFWARAVTPSQVILHSALVPQPAYPWRLDLEVTYELSEHELAVSLEVANESATPAPFGLGFHPYLLAPAGAEAASVELHASTHLLLDERGLPIGEEPISAFRYAPLLHGSSLLGDAVLDDCFGGLEREASGHWSVLFSPETSRGRTLVVRADSAFGYVMIYSADHLGSSEARRAVAIEPMTCPPNALRSGHDLVVIDPGETFRASFSLAEL